MTKEKYMINIDRFKGRYLLRVNDEYTIITVKNKRTMILMLKKIIKLFAKLLKGKSIDEICDKIEELNLTDDEHLLLSRYENHLELTVLLYFANLYRCQWKSILVDRVIDLGDNCYDILNELKFDCGDQFYALINAISLFDKSITLFYIGDDITYQLLKTPTDNLYLIYICPDSFLLRKCDTINDIKHVCLSVMDSFSDVKFDPITDQDISLNIMLDKMNRQLNWLFDPFAFHKFIIQKMESKTPNNLLREISHYCVPEYAPY